MKKICFLIALAFAIPAFPQGQIVGTNHRKIFSGGLTLNPGFQILQDVHLANCSTGSSGCSASNIATQSGSSWIVAASTGNDTTITSISGSSGSWIQPTTHHQFVTGHGGIDVIYNFTGTAGSGTFTVNISAAATGFFFVEFIEFLPPSGYSTVFDTSATASSTSCTTSCPLAALTLSGTDAVFQVSTTGQVVSLLAWNSCPSPYILNGYGTCINMNATSAPSGNFSVQSASWEATVGIAFKSTAGNFSVPSPVFSLANYTSTYPTAPTLNCNPSCNLTIPSTGSGHLLYLQSASKDGVLISSVSDGSNTWVVPTGANTCAKNDSHNNAIACAYVLSSVSGITTVTVTMAANTGNIALTLYEVPRTSGSFTLDAQGSTAQTAATRINGQSLASGCTNCSGVASGTNDVIFAAISSIGGPGGVQYGNMAMPYNPTGINSFAGGNTFFINYANTGIILNGANFAAEVYANDPGNAAVVNKVAFK